MQAALFVCVLLTSAIQLAAQQETIHSKVSRALDGMHAHTWELREKALEEAPDLGDVSKESPDEADRLNLGLIFACSALKMRQRRSSYGMELPLRQRTIPNIMNRSLLRWRP